VNDWKPNFYKDPNKKVASIPFIRNIIEYTKGDNDPQFLKLTSLLHWKADSAGIMQAELDAIYKAVFGGSETSADGGVMMIDIIRECADGCLKAGDGINFENKIVLSIAVRIAAEQFMIKKIDDPKFVAGIDANQTNQLFKKFKELNASETATIDTLQRVVLMTPESIHLNSFMYEPILDMSDEHLRRLYIAVKALT
jgi:hypothetical protein